MACMCSMDFDRAMAVAEVVVAVLPILAKTDVLANAVKCNQLNMSLKMVIVKAIMRNLPVLVLAAVVVNR